MRSGLDCAWNLIGGIKERCNVIMIIEENLSPVPVKISAGYISWRGRKATDFRDQIR